MIGQRALVTDEGAAFSGLGVVKSLDFQSRELYAED
jgi:hypothetical protein